MELKIVFQDEVLFVIDKPSGITVNRSDTTKNEKTVQDWIEEIATSDFEFTSASEDSDFFKRSGIVHRLDKETSGILLAAKTQAAFLHLQEQFKTRIVKKEYITLVHGKVTPRIGEIHVPVGRLPWNRKRFGIIAGGRESTTMYSVRSYYRDAEGSEYSLLDVSPQTGRTHQIRVHMKYLQHPVVSDELYAGRKTSTKDRGRLSRTFLHAAKIQIAHPMSHNQITFESPLPVDLQKFLTELSKE